MDKFPKLAGVSSEIYRRSFPRSGVIPKLLSKSFRDFLAVTPEISPIDSLEIFFRICAGFLPDISAGAFFRCLSRGFSGIPSRVSPLQLPLKRFPKVFLNILPRFLLDFNLGFKQEFLSGNFPRDFRGFRQGMSPKATLKDLSKFSSFFFRAFLSGVARAKMVFLGFLFARWISLGYPEFLSLFFVKERIHKQS